MNTMMKKIGLGAVLAATALSVAAPAEAQHRYRGYRHYGHGDEAGAALLGGLIGLGVGAAIASNNDRDYDRHYYHREHYYERPYYRSHCWSQWRWDPYWGRDVRVRVCD